MKKYLLVFLFFLYSCSFFAQSGKNELGFNASPFLKQLLRSTSFPQESDHFLLLEYGPYMVNFRHYGKSAALRLGAGLIISDNVDDSPRFLEETKRIHLDVRAGFEKRFSLTDRWRAYYGLDAITSHKEVYVKNVFDDVTPTEIKTTFGAGPVLGLQFYFLKNFSLSTESSFYLVWFQNKTRVVEIGDNGFPIFKKFETKGFQSVFNLPLSIFINYRF